MTRQRTGTAAQILGSTFAILLLCGFIGWWLFGLGKARAIQAEQLARTPVIAIADLETTPGRTVMVKGILERQATPGQWIVYRLEEYDEDCRTSTDSKGKKSKSCSSSWETEAEARPLLAVTDATGTVRTTNLDYQLAAYYRGFTDSDDGDEQRIYGLMAGEPVLLLGERDGNGGFHAQMVCADTPAGCMEVINSGVNTAYGLGLLACVIGIGVFIWGIKTALVD